MHSTIIPGMRYRDATAAIEWLCRVFGFEKRVVHSLPDGRIAHAELTLGGGMLMIGSVQADQRNQWIRHPSETAGAETQSPYVIVTDPDAVYQRAKAAGAEILQEITTTDFGSRAFTCRDLEGRLWDVGSYDPWAAPSR